MPFANVEDRRKYRREYMKDYRKVENPRTREQDRRYHRNRKCKQLGVSPEEVDKTFTAQGRCCAICKTKDSGSRNWHLDHDHTTGKFRGVLCHHCNLGLGNFRDTLANLQEAIKYLEERSSRCVDPQVR